MTYCARIKFRCSEGWFFFEPSSEAIEPESFSLNETLTLSKRTPTERFSNARWLVLEHRGFASAEVASERGRTLRNALLWAATRVRIGLDLGNDRPHGMLTQAAKLAFEEKNKVRMKSDVHGLVVVDESRPTRFGWNQSIGSHGIGIDRFRAALLHAFDKEVRFCEREATAFELYNLAFFEVSPRAQLLMLVTTIESLSVRKRLGKAAVAHIDSLVKTQFPEGTADEEQAELLNGIRQLKRQSMSSACRGLVTGLLGGQTFGRNTAVEVLNKAYVVRSKLLHTGRVTIPAGDMVRLVGTLKLLVSRLLIAHVERRSSIGDCRAPSAFSDAGGVAFEHDDATADENDP